MNKLSTEPATPIDPVPERDVAAIQLGLTPANELAASLEKRCCRGVRVSQRPERLTAGVTIDLRVDGPRGSIGIVCDAIDSARVIARPGCLVDSGLDRIYCVSGVDSLLNPAEVAESLASAEPGVFRKGHGRTGRRYHSVTSVEVEKAGPVPPHRSGPAESRAGFGHTGRAA